MHRHTSTHSAYNTNKIYSLLCSIESTNIHFYESVWCYEISSIWEATLKTKALHKEKNIFSINKKKKFRKKKCECVRVNVSFPTELFFPLEGKKKNNNNWIPSHTRMGWTETKKKNSQRLSTIVWLYQTIIPTMMVVVAVHRSPSHSRHSHFDLYEQEHILPRSYYFERKPSCLLRIFHSIFPSSIFIIIIITIFFQALSRLHWKFKKASINE